MTITFPELTEVEGKLAAARKRLHDIFEEAGPEFDMGKVKSLEGDTTAKVAVVRATNEEIDDLAKKAEDLRVILAGAEHGAEYSEGIAEPGDGHGPQHTKSLGELIASDPRRLQKHVPFELPDFDAVKGLGLKTVMTTAAGWAPDVIRGPRVVDFATRPLELLDFIPTTPTDQTSIAFMEETTFTPAAIEVGEGLIKPEAAFALTERTSLVRKIAVFLPVTDEQLEDVVGVQSYIDNRLGFAVRQRLALQILAGDGAGVNLRGILATVGIQTQAKGADPTPDAVYKAMVLIMTTGQATPDAVVFNPLDWQDVRLLRTVDGIYIWGNPSDAGPERIWGLPVLLAQGETQNTALVGAFKQFSELRVKKGLTVEVGLNADDWTKNKQTIRAEMRAALVVYRPTAFCTVTGV